MCPAGHMDNGSGLDAAAVPAGRGGARADTVVGLDEGHAMQEDPWIVRAVDVGYRNCKLVERVDGDYFTILGLPLIALLQELREREVIEI